MAFSISAGTLTGPHHRSRGEANQDFWGSQVAEDIVVVAAADGAGSLKRSRLGAELAVLASITGTLDSIDAGSLPAEAIAAGLQEARTYLLAMEDYSSLGCTLALGLLAPEAWALGVVGDAFGVIHGEDRTHTLVQPASHSEYVNVTRLLTSDAYEPLVMSGDERIAGLSVASDGLTHASVSGENPVSGFWNPLLTRAQEDALSVDDFLSYMDAKERLDDDATLVMVTYQSN